MHGRGSQAGAAASDGATLEGRRRPRVRAASCRVASPESGRRGWNQRRRGGNRRRRGLNRADSVRIGLYRPKRSSQAEIQKKKKKVQTHRLTNLNTQNPHTESHFVQNSQKSYLTPSLIFLLCVLRPSSLFSVFRAFCECCVHTALLQPSGVLSLLFSWIFILCFLQFLSFKLLRNKFVNLKIYVLDCLLCFFSCFFNSCGS